MHRTPDPDPDAVPRRRRARLLTVLAVSAGLAAAAGIAAVSASATPASVARSAVKTVADQGTSLCPGANGVFGPDVCVFSDTMSQATIQADLDAISAQQVPVGSQFDSNRYAIYFEP
jgi:hypothetical protein